jgi:hypothetical protein
VSERNNAGGRVLDAACVVKQRIKTGGCVLEADCVE